MPAALQYISPNDKQARDNLGGDAERTQRTRAFNANLKQYKGNHQKYLVQDQNDPIDDNVVLNVTAQAIDRTISFLFPDLPIFQLDPNQPTPDETWLNDVWKANGGAFLLDKIAQNGALSGHIYIKIIPHTPFPRIVQISPTIPITFWRADDMDTVVWHELKWKIGKDEVLQDYVRNPDNDLWTIYEYKRSNDVAAWTLTDETAWNYPIPPIISYPHLPNAEGYYGIAEITEHTISLNNAINRTASDISKILRYFASPRTIVIGASLPSLQDTKINGVWVIDDEKAKVETLEMKGDLSSSLNYLQLLTSEFLSVSRVVIMKGTVKDFQRVTNTGIRAVFLDMIAKNQMLRWTYGIGLQNICLALLYSGNKDTSKMPTVTWTDPLPADPLETINGLAIEQANGWVDPETASKRLGYEWNTVVSNWLTTSKYDFITQLILKPKANLAKAPNSNSSRNNQNLPTGS